ncbi:MAG: ParA family protein [Candidatus Brocadiales bacterium]|nr:ParA family protein [Candidatus Brocadiales bacterium]
MFENDFAVSLKDFSATFNLAERTPYMMIKGDPDTFKTIKKGKNTFIPSSAVKSYRDKKNLVREGDKVYSFYMRKGGVGKTSLLMNLSAKAVMCGYKVLLIDMDSQANLTKAYKIKDVKTKDTFQDIFDEVSSLREAQIEVKKNLFLIPCNNKFAGLANKIDPMEGYNQFEVIINEAREEYDLVFIDNGGIMDMTIFQTLASSDHVISPAQPDEFSEEGLELTQDEIKKLYKQGIRPKHTIVMNFFRDKEKASVEYHEMFKDIYDKSVAATTIPKSQEFINALNNYDAISLYEHNYSSPVVVQLDCLFSELIEGRKVKVQ